MAARYQVRLQQRNIPERRTTKPNMAMKDAYVTKDVLDLDAYVNKEANYFKKEFNDLSDIKSLLSELTTPTHDVNSYKAYAQTVRPIARKIGDHGSDQSTLTPNQAEALALKYDEVLQSLRTQHENIGNLKTKSGILTKLGLNRNATKRANKERGRTLKGLVL